MTKLLLWLLSFVVRVQNPDRHKVYRLVGSDWKLTRMCELLQGDVVRVPGINSSEQYRVVSLPYPVNQGRHWTWSVDAELIEDPAP